MEKDVFVRVDKIGRRAFIIVKLTSRVPGTCSRPDHFCGYSPRLSVSWCYGGTGPSQSIWRSCNSRFNDQKMTHNVAYLHEGPPPTIQKLTNNEVANLTKDNALL